MLGRAKGCSGELGGAWVSWGGCSGELGGCSGELGGCSGELGALAGQHAAVGTSWDSRLLAPLAARLFPTLRGVAKGCRCRLPKGLQPEGHLPSQPPRSATKSPHAPSCRQGRCCAGRVSAGLANARLRLFVSSPGTIPLTAGGKLSSASCMRLDTTKRQKAYKETGGCICSG